MRKSRVIGAVMATVAAFGMTMVTASPAAAASWNSFPTGETVTCSVWQNHPLTNSVEFRMCIIHGAGPAVQPLLSVKNNGPYAIRLKGSSESTWNSAVYCPDSYLSSGLETTCMGKTEAGNPAWDYAYGDLWLYSASTWHYGVATKYL
ncbi:hypothetical protein [Streptomyces sp. NPDC005953]|uniref:hypothetical protein n=1 Tax=Streptomyces sp. NPDC005953 TaxID=3156719 RepID=UPI0033D33A1F